MISYLGNSQSLIPSIIEIDSNKYYCYDSVSIREVAVHLNNSFTCDSITNSQNETIKSQGELISNKDKEVKNLEKQVQAEEEKNLLEKEKNLKVSEEKDKQIKKLKLKNTLLIVFDVAIIVLVTLF